MEQEQINPNFDIPYYIFEEITEYIELTAKGHCKCMKWDNIKSLLNLAVINKRFFLSLSSLYYLLKSAVRDRDLEKYF